ncbi:MAG: hypothetical protein F4X11_26255 [Acidobacteria bacterium]|nr:hypothetical protein [Acidobacteriota bacterium]
MAVIWPSCHRSPNNAQYDQLVIHRVSRGSLTYKRAILATARKLLRVIHAVLRHDRPYTDPGIDYERLVVARNAPRSDPDAHAPRIPRKSASCAQLTADVPDPRRRAGS